MAMYVKIGDTSIATTALGGAMGNRNARQVMKILFNKAISSHPRLEAWDNAAQMNLWTAPTSELLAGTASTGNKSWLAAADTTSALPSANWYANADERSKGTSPAKLMGSGAYLLLDGATIGVVSRMFNLALKVPSDAVQVGTTQHTPIIACRFYYTGSTPTLSWQYNASTVATPRWSTFNTGTNGYKLCFTGPDQTTNIADPFTKPTSLTEVAQYWIKTV